MTGPEEEKRIAVDLARRIANGDLEAEKTLFSRYYKSTTYILFRRSKDHALAEDLAQETLLKVLHRLREGSIEEPEYLSRFIQQTAKYLFIGWTRKRTNQTELRADVGDLADEHSVAMSYEREETRRIVREVIGNIKIPRDRELLRRYYVHDEEKSAICEALDLSADHFDRVISRARNRFRDMVDGSMFHD